MTERAGAHGELPGGALVVSVDFELAWGLRESRGTPGWRERVEGARAVVPRLLDLLERRRVHATWGVVGALALSGWRELREALPAVAARFADPRLRTDEYLAEVGDHPEEEPLHFAPELVAAIAATPGQELATHTFAHYHCGEPGHTEEAFEADLVASLGALERFGPRPRSIIFPKNQVAPQCLAICARHGIAAYRGVAPGWLHAPRRVGARGPSLRRALRLLDEGVALSGSNAFGLATVAGPAPRNVPASRLFLPRGGSALRNRLLVRRVTGGLRHAARRGLIYHLWWHPHNFALDTDRRLALLDEVLDEFAALRTARGMVSLTMQEAAAAAGDAG